MTRALHPRTWCPSFVPPFPALRPSPSAPSPPTLQALAEETYTKEMCRSKKAFVYRNLRVSVPCTLHPEQEVCVCGGGGQVLIVSRSWRKQSDFCALVCVKHWDLLSLCYPPHVMPRDRRAIGTL
jgi:hypothetical protein